MPQLSQGSRRVEFVCHAQGASEVQLILKSREMVQERIIPMTMSDDHHWFAILRLPLGLHRFVYQAHYAGRVVVHEMGILEQTDRLIDLGHQRYDVVLSEQDAAMGWDDPMRESRP